MTKKKDYTCPRCGYTSYDKTAIRRHFYNLKKPCPASENDVELSEEIKLQVLTNRVYHMPKHSSIQNINNQINNYNQINNIVAGMDTIQKITRYNDYKNLELLEFEDRVDNQYHLQVKKLDTNRYPGFRLSLQNIMEVIDSVTSMLDVDTFNVLYEEIPNKLKIFCYGGWRCMILEAGIKEIVEKIQTCYLDHYECYLLRKIYADDTFGARQKQVMREHLEEYYRFIACFDLQPYVKEKTDGEIMSTTSSSYNIEETWHARYISIKGRLTNSEVNKIKREVQNMVKKNSKANILDLNKRMMEVIHVDVDFKNDILANITSAMSISQPI